jgi:hypothetical protein
MWVYGWVDLLSPTVLSHHVIFIFYDVEFDLWFSVESFGLSSTAM